MNELTILQKQQILGKQLTLYGDIDNPLFLAKEVAEWIEHSDVSTMIRNIDDDEKLTQTLFVSGQNREMWFLTEDGVYEVLMQSRKTIAKQFKKEVKAVLKSIRKHGIYATDNVVNAILENPDFGIQLLSQLKQERAEKEKLKTENLQQKQIIGELKPKADYTNTILRSKKLVTITQIAKDYGMSGTEMNKLLHTLEVQYKQGNQWLLYKKYHNKGYVHSETFTFKRSNGKEDVEMVTKWTQKGRLFLYNLLKEEEILPLIEQEEKIA